MTCYAQPCVWVVGLTQQNHWVNSKALIGIFSQTSRSTCECWVNFVNFTFILEYCGGQTYHTYAPSLRATAHLMCIKPSRLKSSEDLRDLPPTAGAGGLRGPRRPARLPERKCTGLAQNSQVGPAEMTVLSRLESLRFPKVWANSE